MKYLFIIFFNILLVNSIYPKDLIMDTAHKIVKDQVYDLHNGMKIIAFNLEGHTRNNLGYYGKTKLLDLNVFCEITFQDGSKLWSKAEREGELNQAGVGQSKIIDATDKLKSLVGVECIYAVSKVLDSDFIKTKCKITDSLFNQLRIQ
jgi:hypothetical protein